MRGIREVNMNSKKKKQKIEDIVAPLQEQIKHLSREVDKMKAEVDNNKKVSFTKIYIRSYTDDDISLSLAYVKLPSKAEPMKLLRAFPRSTRDTVQELDRMLLLAIYGILESTVTMEFGSYICFYIADPILSLGLEQGIEEGITEENKELFQDIIEMIGLARVPVVFEEPSLDGSLWIETTNILETEADKINEIRRNKDVVSEREHIYSNNESSQGD